MSDPTPDNSDGRAADVVDAAATDGGAGRSADFYEQQQEMGDETHKSRVGSFFLVALFGIGILTLTRTFMVDSEPMRSDSALIDDSSELQPSAVHGQIEIPTIDAAQTPEGTGGDASALPGSANTPDSQEESPQ